jgi:hypothetical protein
METLTWIIDLNVKAKIVKLLGGNKKIRDLGLDKDCFTYIFENMVHEFKN